MRVQELEYGTDLLNSLIIFSLALYLLLGNGSICLEKLLICDLPQVSLIHLAAQLLEAFEHFHFVSFVLVLNEHFVSIRIIH